MSLLFQLQFCLSYSVFSLKFWIGSILCKIVISNNNLCYFLLLRTNKVQSWADNLSVCLNTSTYCLQQQCNITSNASGVNPLWRVLKMSITDPSLIGTQYKFQQCLMCLSEIFDIWYEHFISYAAKRLYGCSSELRAFNPSIQEKKNWMWALRIVITDDNNLKINQNYFNYT